jgi:hypothetical protein
MLSSQPPSSILAPQLFQNSIWTGVVTSQDVPPLQYGFNPPDLHLFQESSRGDVFYTEQQSRGSRTAVDTTDVIDATDDNDGGTVTFIGSVLSNGKYVCNDESCASQTFGRPSELRRHHTTLHASNKPSFWCHDPGCHRSAGGGGEAFHRKDKLTAHVKSMHS